MKIAMLFIAVFAMLRGQSLAQAFEHRISLYADPSHISPAAYDLSPGILSVFVVHEAEPQESAHALSSGFKILPSAEFTGVWLSDLPVYSVFGGTSPTGISLGYSSCSQPPLPILEVRYTIFGTSGECSYLEVVAHPDYPAPAFIDCDFELLFGTGGRLTINPNDTCSPLPVETTTWGGIKALYR